MIEKNTIKSQDSLIDCNEGKRSSETLLQAIEKAERLQKQLDIAKEYLNELAYKDKRADWVLLKIEELNK